MFSFPEAARFLGACLEFPDPSASIQGASIDTRSIQPGNLFVALKGAAVDGHDFLDEAFRKGASGALIASSHANPCHPFLSGRQARTLSQKNVQFFAKSARAKARSAILSGDPDSRLPRKGAASLKACGNDESNKIKNLLFVQDPQEAFAKLAAHYRASFAKLKTVGITGSVGKTSTKEFLSYLLAKSKNVLATKGNLNNHLGLPLTLFQLDTSHEFLVAELGANHPGEIAFLSDILKPHAGIITRIAPAHIEGFGSLEAIYDAKLELFSALPKGGPAVIWDEDLHLIEKARNTNAQLILVGSSSHARYHLRDIRVLNHHVHFKFQKREFAFPGFASFLSSNAGLALAMVCEMSVSLSEIPEVWSDLKPPAGRFEERITREGVRVIDDGYNANPESFKRALEAFSSLKAAGKKILVFADMLELGSEENYYHEQLGLNIARTDLEMALAYGPRSKRTIEVLAHENSEIIARHFANAQALADFLKSTLAFGDAVLFKASRGMKIEEARKSLNVLLSPLP